MARSASDMHNLGCDRMDKLDYNGAEKWFFKSITEAPEADPLTYDYLGCALANQGKFKEGLYWDRKSVEIWPANAQCHVDLALSLLRLGKFEEGWKEWEWRRIARQDDRMFSMPKWRGEDLKGKSIFIFCEEGLGDTVQFIRYIPELIKWGAKVTVEVQPHLETLIRQSFPQVNVVTRNLFDIANGVKTDYCYPMLSLAGIFQDIPVSGKPYLSCPVAQWPTLDGRKRVGIVWQGNPKHPNDKLRSIDPELLKPLLALPQVNWISLQQEGTVEGAIDLTKELKNFNRTAAVIDSLDLVITVDTAVAHVAGALGAPCWLLLPYVSDWRWGQDESTCMWYDSVRLFRQKKPGDWKQVIEKVIENFEIEIPNRLVLEYNTRYGPIRAFTNDQWVCRALDRYGEFSEGECELFRKVVKDGQTVVDGGANIGYHTNVFSKIVGTKGTVIAFEPLPEVFKLLTENMTINDCQNVLCAHAALSDKPGTIARSILPSFGGEEEGPAFIDLLTLDQVDQKVDFIKLDIEGMELQALQGGENLIARDKPILYVENDREPKSAMLIQWLMAHDYFCYWHLPPIYNKNNFKGNEKNFWGDVRSVNMLCFPTSYPLIDAGIPLKRILSPTANWKSAL